MVVDMGDLSYPSVIVDSKFAWKTITSRDWTTWNPVTHLHSNDLRGLGFCVTSVHDSILKSVASFYVKRWP